MGSTVCNAVVTDPDLELVAAVDPFHSGIDLRQVTGVDLPGPVDSHVQRWGGALPQYAPGHLDRVAAARAALRTGHPTLVLVGAGYDGVGIPACVRSGETGADEINEVLGGCAP